MDFNDVYKCFKDVLLFFIENIGEIETLSAFLTIFIENTNFIGTLTGLGKKDKDCLKHSKVLLSVISKRGKYSG